MSFVIVGEAECEPGKFMDEVQPEARHKARTLDGTLPAAPQRGTPESLRPRRGAAHESRADGDGRYGDGTGAPRPETAEVIAELVVAVRQSQDVLDYFARFASAEERQIAEARLARNREALHLYRRWVTP